MTLLAPIHFINKCKNFNIMMKINIPNIGTEEAVEIIEILVKDGDIVSVDQALLVLESDKASMEVPSPAAGKITKLLVKVGDKVKEGDAIADITEEDGGKKATKEEVKTEEEKEPKQEIKSIADKGSKQESLEAPSPQNEEGKITVADVYAGPAVRKLAREFGINLSQVRGSGNNGRVILEDIQTYVKNQLGGGGGSALPPEPEVDFAEFGKVEVVEMDKIKRLTADGMQAAALNAPHVTQFDDADVTDLEAFRAKQKKRAEKKGVKLTPVPFLIKALALALQEFPQFNVSVKGHSIVQKYYYHIGMAVDTPAGLVVPIIRDVDKKGVWQLAAEVMEISDKARNRRLGPKDMEGGCITLSSLGASGGTQFTPIINLPEVAILGVSRVKKVPVYVGEELQPRLVMPLALSYDHRAVNGVEGAKFTRFLAEILTDARNLAM